MHGPLVTLVQGITGRGGKLKGRPQALQAAVQLIQRLPEWDFIQHPVVQDLLLAAMKRRVDLCHRPCHRGQRLGKIHGTALFPLRHDNVPAQLLQLEAGQGKSEKVRSHRGQTVCLIENHRIAMGQQFPEPVILERPVGQEQVVVDHDDVPLERLLPRLHHMAPGMFGAFPAQAVVGRGRDQAPYRGLLADALHLRNVSFTGTGSPARDLGKRRIIVSGQAGLGHGLPQAVPAQVVAAAFQHDCIDAAPQDPAHLGDVAVEDLVLQMPRPGRYHGPHPLLDHRNQVGVGLAGPGTGFRHQRASLGQYASHFQRHFLLRPAGHEPRQPTVKQPVVRQCVAMVLRSGHRPAEQPM